jgi:protein disulfide-isomerase
MLSHRFWSFITTAAFLVLTVAAVEARAQDKAKSENPDKPAQAKEAVQPKEPAQAKDGVWTTDFEKAKAQAKAEKKWVLVCFVGSDWNDLSKHMRDEVFSKELFLKEATKQFVLVEVDFPEKVKQSDELKKQNLTLRERYQVQGFPTILILAPDGKEIAYTSYQSSGAEKFLANLNELVGIHVNLPEWTKSLDKLQGVERAKMLDKIIEGVMKLGVECPEITKIPNWCKEIITLDPDNKAGLKVKYEFHQLMTDCVELRNAGRVAEARKMLDKATQLQGLSNEQMQALHMFKADFCLRVDRDLTAVTKCLQDAQKIDPKSEAAKQCELMLKELKPLNDAIARIAAVKLELAEAQGIPRAKLLDELLTLEKKTAGFARIDRKDSEKWLKEIIELDADGKAGLKGKYAVESAIAEASRLYEDQTKDRTAEAEGIVVKALATPGLAPENVQHGYLFLGICMLKHGDAKKGVEYLQKSYDADPKGPGGEECKRCLDSAKSILALQAEEERINKQLNEQKPGEKKSSEQKPGEKKPLEQKPGEKKPLEQKPVEQPGEKK